MNDAWTNDFTNQLDATALSQNVWVPDAAIDLGFLVPAITDYILAKEQMKKSGPEMRAKVQAHFSQRHLTPDERRARTQRELSRGYILHSRPPWYLYVAPAEKSDDPAGDAAFLKERRAAGDIIVPNKDGGCLVFPIGTPQDHIDYVFERHRRIEARHQRGRELVFEGFRKDLSQDERLSRVSAFFAKIPDDDPNVGVRDWFLFVHAPGVATLVNREKLLAERRAAGDIVVENPDGSSHVFAKGTPQFRIDHVVEGYRATLERLRRLKPRAWADRRQ